MKTNINAKKAQKTVNDKKLAGKSKTASKVDILDCFEKIVEITKNESLENQTIEEINNAELKKCVGFVSRRLNITPLQAVLFSHFMNRSFDQNINMYDIASSINCNNIKILKYVKEFEALEKKKLIRCNRGSDALTYRIPQSVCDSLRKYNTYKLTSNKNLSIEKLFSALEKLFYEKSNNELSFNALTMELKDLMEQNLKLQFCRKILSYNLYDNDFTLLLLFCHLSGNNDDDNIGFHDIDFLYDERHEFFPIKKALSKGNHSLIEAKFVEFNNNNGFLNSESWRLSDMAKKELLSELGTFNGNQDYMKSLMKHDSIKPKKMYYNPKETEAVESLTNLLQEENFKKILKRLDKKGMRKGFACIFSGPPGTGKTETAYQLAKATGRHLMMVDISESKSCWFGESEKRVKKIFDTYREAVENSKIAPILVFNEADALISKRRMLDDNNSHGPDQTENAIQNIILQEIENLNGILIATTNLTQNMDSAFERRFLYKIVFNKPSIESRIGIWKTMLPDLPEENITELATKYDLSGGQIENITRKLEVDSILKGKDSWMYTLDSYCKEELSGGFKEEEKRIGFV